MRCRRHCRGRPRHIADTELLGILHQQRRIDFGSQIIVAVIVIVAKLADQQRQIVVFVAVHHVVDIVRIIECAVRVNRKQQVVPRVVVEQFPAIQQVHTTRMRFVLRAARLPKTP